MNTFVKRACTNWGVGRELYSSPRIFIKVDTQKKQGGRGYELCDPYIFYGAEVSDIEYDEKRKIKALTIVDEDGVVLYSYPKKKASAPKKEVPKKEEPKKEAPAPKKEEPTKLGLSGTDIIMVEDAKWLKDKLFETNSDTAKFLEYVGEKAGHRINSVDEMIYSDFDIASQAINKKLAKK